MYKNLHIGVHSSLYNQLLFRDSSKRLSFPSQQRLQGSGHCEISSASCFIHLWVRKAWLIVHSQCVWYNINEKKNWADVSLAGSWKDKGRIKHPWAGDKRSCGTRGTGIVSQFNLLLVDFSRAYSGRALGAKGSATWEWRLLTLGCPSDNHFLV